MPSLVTGIIGGIQGSSAAHNAAAAQQAGYKQAGETVAGAVADANPIITGTANVNGLNLVNNANDINEQMKGVSAGIRSDLSPYTSLGSSAAGTLSQLSAPGANVTQLMQQLDPGYNFRLNQGILGTEQSAAAHGLLQSGAAARGVNNYAQNYASNEYGNTFNRLAQLSQLGAQNAQFQGTADLNANQFGANTQQRALGQAGQWNVNAGDLTASNLINSGVFQANGQIGASNAQAQGDIGAANSWNGMLGAIGQTGNSLLAGGFSGGGGFSFGNMLKGMTPGQGVAPGGPSYNMQPAAPSWYSDLGYIG